jgi:hypothetical protein
VKVLLLQLDGALPNLALMKLSAYHKALGDAVAFRRAPTVAAVDPGLLDTARYDSVYASAIFSRTRPVCERVLEAHPHAIIGGSGWDETASLEKLGVPANARPDYSLYPGYRHSLGYTQRGCTFSCSFCVVPRMEGRNRPAAGVLEIWRGEPWPKELHLLDNDFFGQKGWQRHIEDMRAGRFAVCFNQGINVRTLSDEHAAALASVRYSNSRFTDRRVYTAWDNRPDEATLFRGLERLARHGVRPQDVLVYMLVGYDHATKSALPKLTPDDFHRRQRLREFGAMPYPMPFVRTRELVGFQRWCVGYFDVPRGQRPAVPWEEWERAGYEPRRLGRDQGPTLFDG